MATGNRDNALAVQQLRETIIRQLVTCPPGGRPVELADDLVDNLARTIASALDEYGRAEDERAA